MICLQNIKPQCVIISIYQTNHGNKRFKKKDFTAKKHWWVIGARSPGCVGFWFFFILNQKNIYECHRNMPQPSCKCTVY